MYTTTNIVLFLAIIAIPALAQAGISFAYNKYKKVSNTPKLSGFEVARKILDANGMSDMDIVTTGGELSDHYDPSRKVVRLSYEIFNGTSIASMAVAAHECGHAIQDHENYFMLKLRSLIVPVVKLGTAFSYIVILIGCLFELLNLVYIGIALTGLGLLFQLITLPVEIDASRRAGVQLKALGIADSKDSSGTKKVLTAAAMTYVAGVLSSALQVLRLIMMFQRRD
ncbi:MAG: zinc metallopeptidase [Bacilli bacterium]|nr:zinc metallopeptidase [Bacilli bacterium]